jgi:ribose-phosphate pyrophosphokinase
VKVVDVMTAPRPGAETERSHVGSPLEESRFRLFVLDAESTFGRGVAMRLGVEAAAHEDRQFEDGEHKVRPLVSVRDADVFILASLYSDAAHTVHDRLCRLLFFTATVRDAAAARVTVVAPYLCYARKDRRTKARDPVTTRYVATLLEAAGCDAVLAMDVHNPAAYQNAFRRRAEHLEGRPLFVAHLTPLLGSEDVVVVSPDAGGVKRADALRASLGRTLGRPIELAFMEKKRSEGVVSGEAFVGDVAGRTAVIVDDLISSGTTLARAARACAERGATRSFAVVTHGLFNEGARAALEESALERLIVLNTVPPMRLPEQLLRERVTVLDAAPLVAEAIRRLHSGGSLVELLEA